MLADLEADGRLRGLDRPLGPESRDLVLGQRTVRIAGLAAPLAADLGRRWGPFLGASAAGQASSLVLRVYEAGPGPWLEPPVPGAAYRLEARNEPGRRIVVSHHFALARDADPGAWRLGVTATRDEPLPRILENATRFLAARLALDDGGFALHAAAVLHDGEAHLFAGPSGAGKTTAVRLARPARSLGDDFAMVVPVRGRWMAPALPFDNSERIAPDALRGMFPVSGIWRLAQAGETRVERFPASVAIASLLGCAAFPWALPEAAEALLAHVTRYVAEGRFGRFHFALDADPWRHLA